MSGLAPDAQAGMMPVSICEQILEAVRLKLERIIGLVQAKEDGQARSALNAPYASALMVLIEDTSLGGLAIDFRESELRRAVLFAEEALSTAEFELSLEAEFATLCGDPLSL